MSTQQLSEREFKAVEKAVKQAVFKVVAKYGGDYEELYSQALECLCRAYSEWNESRGPFLKWALFVIHCDLTELRRRELTFQSRYKNEPGTYEPSNVKRQFVETLDEMSQDAQDIVALIFDAPTCLRQLLMHDTKTELHSEFRHCCSPSRTSIQATIRRHLTQLGWQRQRIADAFNNIAEAIA